MHVHRQVQRFSWTLDQPNDLRRQRIYRRTPRHNIRFGKASPQVAFTLIETDSAQPLHRRGDQHRPKAGRRYDIGNGNAPPAVLPGAWAHAQMPLRIDIGAARRIIARVVDRFSHAAPSLQCRLQSLSPQRAGVNSRRQPHLPLEQPMKMMRRIACMRCDNLQGRRDLAIGDECLGRLHRQPVPPDFIRPAAQACPKARRSGGLRVGQKDHILPPGMPRGAAWFAVDAGRQHRTHEASVHRPVSPQEGIPAGIIIQRQRRYGGKVGHMVHPYGIAAATGPAFPRLALKAFLPLPKLGFTI